MSTDNDQIAGRRAKELLEDPVMQQAFRALHDTYLDAWERTETDDKEGRERLFMAVQALEHVALHLRVLSEAGRLASAQIEKLKNKRRRLEQ